MNCKDWLGSTASKVFHKAKASEEDKVNPLHYSAKRWAMRACHTIFIFGFGLDVKAEMDNVAIDHFIVFAFES